jgi:hypothetical protein
VITSLDEIFQTEEVKTIRVRITSSSNTKSIINILQIHAEMLNSLMTNMNAREDVFTLGPLSHIIAREYTQMANVKQRRKVFENEILFLFSYIVSLRPVKIK